jgi:opacity protein-like surface antigen
MKRLLFCTAILATLLTEGFGQELNCTQKLRTARNVYEQGRLHELPVLLEGCLKSGFSETEKIEAYRLLVLTYIYLEEPAKADAAMLSLLETNHFFEINPLVDPVEFINLHKKFRTTPIFSYGFKFGVNTNHVSVLKNYYIWGASKGKGEYKSKFGIQVGFLAEKNLTDNLIINPEIFYNGNTFLYTNSFVSYSDTVAQNADKVEFTIKQSHLQLNILIQYKMKDSKLHPYISIGPGIGYLISSSVAGDVTVGSQVTIPTTETMENYKALSYSVIASAGVKYKVGSFYMTADIRYQRGFGNIVKKENRFKPTPENQQLLYNGFVHNDLSISQSMVNIGLIVPFFRPKKLIK